MRQLLFPAALRSGPVLLAGCAGYHLGPVNGAVAGEKSIEVLPFNNQTLQPRLGDALTQALREELQTDGTYHLATRDPGDVVVTGVITSYNREGLSFLSADVATPQDYRVDDHRARHRARTRHRQGAARQGCDMATRWSMSAAIWRTRNGRRFRCWRRIWREISPSF